MSKKYRKIITAVMALFVGITSIASSGQVYAAKKTVTFAATGTSFPTAYQKNGKLVGFDVAVANTAAKRLGYNVKWVTGSFDGLFGQLDNDKVDSIPNDVAITPERAKKYLFSTVYNREETTVAVAKTAKLKTLKDLEGKTVAGGAESNNTTNLRNYDKKINIKTFEGRDDIYQALLSGHVDGVINTRTNLKAVIKAKKYDWKVLKGQAASVNVALPFKKTARGKKLNQQFNKALKQMIKDGTIKKLSNQYFGYDITPNLVQKK
ncbi:transporter substrate-binding domain-containing protein [Agrilactobacillus yilanensis]|uniref:Transporter substrate-binding domain-containing protein n=1 Tax=Agrilactobacillus yilanensis TaxID=2485997 RepID=A0ABW4J4I5_9LACO|nr:transporter substrate-binding domain-containing protein [Agrilactobacillus yilanensis]